MFDASRQVPEGWAFTAMSTPTLLGIGVGLLSAERCVPHKQAPAVGGTVVVIHNDQTGHLTGVDVLLDAIRSTPVFTRMRQ